MPERHRAMPQSLLNTGEKMSTTTTKEIDVNGVPDLVSDTEEIRVDADTSASNLVNLYAALKHLASGSPAYDAFARLRVSTPVTLFESKQIISEQNLLWERGQVSGAGGTFLYSRPRASSTIGVTANTAGRYVRRTRRYFNYQPGKGQLVLMSAILGPKATGINRRIGYFDDANGVFFGVNHESIYCAVRSSVTGVPVTTLYHQGQWNIDKMDGTGPSGITLHTDRPQVYWFDFEWLGVGRVRWGVFINGVPVLMHEFNCANSIDCTSVYMSTPALPLSAEIENDGTGGAATLEQICSAIMSEGGERIQGAARSVNRATTPLTVTNAANRCPVISIRARTGFEFNTINILNFDILGTGNVPFLWELILNPTLAGVDGAVWVPVGSSSVEYDVSRTQLNFVTDGIVIDSGYVSTLTRGVTIKPQSFLGLGKRLLAGDPKDQFVLAVRNVSGNNDYYGAMQYEEAT